MDITEVILHQHMEQRRMFAMLDEIARDDTPTLRAIWHRLEILLETHAEGWTVRRMASLDRTILRVGVYELLWSDDVPTSVAISEAVEAAAELSAADAKRFVNGVLGRIARDEGVA